MRQALINANPDLASANPKYVMQITGDNAEGKLELDNFINPRKAYPVTRQAVHTLLQLLWLQLDPSTVARLGQVC